MKTPMLILALAASSVPFCAPQAQSRGPQPRPSLESSVGWTQGNWPPGETIRFSAASSHDAYTYAIQISRPSRTAGATVHLVKLDNREHSNQEWTFPLGATDAKLFFEQASEIETQWAPEKYIILDGTAFHYEHRRAGIIRQLQLSAATTGVNRRLSRLMLRLTAIARGEMPDSPYWSAY